MLMRSLSGDRGGVSKSYGRSAKGREMIRDGLRAAITVPARILGPAGVAHAQAPPELEPPRAPIPAELVGEAIAGLEAFRLAAAAPRLAAAARGSNRPTLDIPGWRAHESSMAPIRTYLRRLGHDCSGWGRGMNWGNVEEDVEALVPQVEKQAARGRPVALVGWSLGGVIAREIAREVPESVAGVVTFGTPVIGGPAYTVGARSYGAEEAERIIRTVEELDRENPIQVPITAIFTKRDGIVNWPACIDRTSAAVRHVEVRSSHLGLGIDPDVWLAVAQALHELDASCA